MNLITINNILKEKFGHDSLREAQKNVIDAASSNDDIIVLIPIHYKV